MDKITSRWLLIFGAAFIALFSSYVSVAFADLPDTWSTTGSMGTSRRHAQSALLPDGRILVVGGVNTTGVDFSGSVFFNTAEIYDPVTGTWSATGSLTTGGRALHTTELLRNGKVLIAGGWNGSTGTADLFYDDRTFARP